MRLCTLDCGRIDVADRATFSDTGDHDGERGPIAVPCVLLEHGTDWRRDAGLGDEIAATPAGRAIVGLHFRVSRTLAAQLAELRLVPDNVPYVGPSRLHADHSRNAALFPHAPFLVAPAELAWASATPSPDGVQPDRVAAGGAAGSSPYAGTGTCSAAAAFG